MWVREGWAGQSKRATISARGIAQALSPVLTSGHGAGNHANRQDVVALGGVELLLSQCSIDPASPMAKEWALLAVRNLTETCDTAHARIRSLTAQGVEQTEEMAAAGVRLEVDEASGKLKAVQEPRRHQQLRTGGGDTGAGSSSNATS